MIDKQNKDFESLFNEENEFVEYIETHEIVNDILNTFGNKSINELILEENKLQHLYSHVQDIIV